MHTDFNTENTINNGILFIHAYNVKIRVSNNQLLIDYRNPVKGERARITSLCLNRATSGLKRLIISGDDGYISLRALRWLSEIKASIMQIGYDNDLYLASVPPGNDYPALRRFQVLAGFTPIGIEIIRYLLIAKINGQIELIYTIGGRQSILSTAIDSIEQSDDPNKIMGYEGQASSAYWSYWKDVVIRFNNKDKKNIPDHWNTFRKRVSDLGSRPKNATNPANAMLNYLYTILKGETTTALLTIGLDPGIGLLHSDNEFTPNLSLDVMEPVRPRLDAWFLNFIEKRIFSKNEFYEMEDGSVRMAGILRRELSEFGPIAYSLVAPWAEYVVHSLEREFNDKSILGTPLTRDNRKMGRVPYRIKSTEKNIKPKVEKRCLQCGKPTNSRNLYCSDCVDTRRNELQSAFVSAGINRLKELRNSGILVAHGGETARKRGDKQRMRQAARKTWELLHPNQVEIEKQRFIREIQPTLRNLSVREIVKIFHCSLRYASLIREGKYIPHPALYSDLDNQIEK